MAGVQATYTDRPTITYQPMTGQKFLHGLLTPIDPKNIFFLLQSGYAADFVLGMAVQSLNGVRNRTVSAGVAREADPEFVRVLQLLREAQAAGAVGMRVEVNKNKEETAVVFFRRENLTPEILEKTIEIRRLLRMPEGLQKFNLVYSPMIGATNELAVGSRSMFQIMSAFASYTDVPESDLKEQRALPTFSSTNNTAAGEQTRDQMQPGETGERLCLGALPQSLVLGGRPGLAHKAGALHRHIHVHHGGHRRQRTVALDHHPGA